MARGLNLDIGANTRDFQKGTKDVETALEKVSDALDDVSRDGEKSAEKLERSFSEAQRDISRSSQKIATDLKSDTRRATAETSADLKEFGNEAKQNLAETLSSFDGTVEGTLAGIQGTLGGVVGGLTGIVPIIAAAAGAAGLGLIMTAFQAGGEEAERMREKVSELAAEFIETGEIGEASLAFIVDGLKEMATSTDEGVTNLAELQRQARGAASGFEAIAQAYAGNLEGLEDLIAAEEERLAVLKKADEEAYARANDQANFDHSKVTNQQKVIEGLKEQQKVAEEAALAEAAYAASGAAELEAKAARIAMVNDAYDEQAGKIEDFINEESGLFDVSAYLAAMDARAEALRTYQESVATSGLSSEAISFIESQGSEAAAAFLAGYMSGTPEQKAALNAHWTEAAHENSGSYRATVQSDFTGGAHIRGPGVELQLPDVNAILGRLQSNMNGTILRVRAVVTDRNGKEID